ncbi:hypothetical protein JXQ70_02390 [bacterium]|nr:hypothetical protein [bacterium]
MKMIRNILIIVIVMIPVTNSLSDEKNCQTENYAMIVAEILSGINSCDPTIREYIITNKLSLIKGDEADTIRVLIWLKENELHHQEIILRQLFLTSTIREDELVQKLHTLNNIYDQVSIQKRSQLITKITANTKVIDEFKQSELISPSDSIKRLPMNYFNLNVLVGEKQKKIEAYENFSCEKGNLATVFRMLLWIAEPEEELQKIILIQARRAEDVRDNSYITELLRLTENLSEDQRKQRIHMIEELWNTKIEAQ